MKTLDDTINKDYSSTKNINSENDWLEDFLTNLEPNANKPENLVLDEFEFDNTDSFFDSFLSNILPSSEQDSSTENKINEARTRKLDYQLTQEFISLLREEDFEFGFKTRSEHLISEQLQINALATRNWLNEIFLNYYSDEIIIIGILRIIGRFDPIQIFPQGQTIALAALTHKNDEIKELGIRAFEHWCSIESLNILKKLDLEKEWLKEYVNEVITDFEEQLCHI